MTTKWKIFRVANYIQLIISLGILILIAYRFIILNAHITFDIYTFLFILVLIIVIGNNCMNLHILSAHFPDKALPNFKKTFSHILFGFYVATTLTLSILYIWGLSEGMANGNYREDGLWIFLLLFTILVITSIFIAINQTGLPKLIYENNRRSLLQMMDDIGTT